MLNDNHATVIANLKKQAHMLNGLFGQSLAATNAWSEHDFQHMIEHQLSTRLADALPAILPSVSANQPALNTYTFQDVLLNPAPDPVLLTHIKDFAKQLMIVKRHGCPEPVASALYFASLAAAHMARLTISGLPENDRIAGCTWAVRQSWMPEILRGLFTRAL